MTGQSWECPVCRRGVAPGEKTCDHGGGRSLLHPNWPDGSVARPISGGTIKEHPDDVRDYVYGFYGKQVERNQLIDPNGTGD